MRLPATAGEALQVSSRSPGCFLKIRGAMPSCFWPICLDGTRLALLTHPERLLSPAEADQFESMLSRRLASEPGAVHHRRAGVFWPALRGLARGPHPAARSGTLVEAVLERFGREACTAHRRCGNWLGRHRSRACACGIPRSWVTAVDLSSAALEVAQRNAERHGVLERLTLLQSDLLESVNAVWDFDVVVSNPPYIAGGRSIGAAGI